MARVETGMHSKEHLTMTSTYGDQVNQNFLFSASSPGSWGDDTDARQGLALNHAYSIIKAVDEKDEDGTPHRLVLVR